MDPSQRRRKALFEHLREQEEIDRLKRLAVLLQGWVDEHPPQSIKDKIINGVILAEVKRILEILRVDYGVTPPRN